MKYVRQGLCKCHHVVLCCDVLHLPCSRELVMNTLKRLGLNPDTVVHVRPLDGSTVRLLCITL